MPEIITCILLQRGSLVPLVFIEQDREGRHHYAHQQCDCKTKRFKIACCELKEDDVKPVCHITDVIRYGYEVEAVVYRFREAESRREYIECEDIEAAEVAAQVRDCPDV